MGTVNSVTDNEMFNIEKQLQKINSLKLLLQKNADGKYY